MCKFLYFIALSSQTNKKWPLEKGNMYIFFKNQNFFYEIRFFENLILVTYPQQGSLWFRKYSQGQGTGFLTPPPLPFVDKFVYYISICAFLKCVYSGHHAFRAHLLDTPKTCWLSQTLIAPMMDYFSKTLAGGVVYKREELEGKQNSSMLTIRLVKYMKKQLN